MRIVLPPTQVTGFPAGVRRALLLRSFLVQGSWNYQTLIGTGFAFVLLPALRYVFRGDPEALQQAVERHSGLFNSHPYLAGVAAGAVARMEAEGAAAELIGRFKDALRSSLGSIGDQLVWSGWRPAAALLAIALLLTGAPWWLAVVTFLIVYNSLHLWLRVWALDVGIRAGLSVGQALRAAPLQRLAHRATDAGALLAGFCAMLAVAEGGRDQVALTTAAAAAVVGVALGTRARWAVWSVLALVWIAGIMIGAMRGSPN
ncbi:MAG TPA: PTS system mannose/fructose/sorbose family transporter subunit IID [Longimicrobiaceae bacterium]|nr:PTS system mannose/fructose/sorbose family transporter subunit IID [Longimicrobiaceae bacterium]